MKRIRDFIATLIATGAGWDLLALAGLGLMALGFALIYLPLAFVFLGAACFLVAALSAWSAAKRKQSR